KGFFATNFGSKGNHFDYIFSIIEQLSCLFNCGRMNERFHMRATFCNIDPGAFEVETENSCSSALPVFSHCVYALVKNIVFVGGECDHTVCCTAFSTVVCKLVQRFCVGVNGEQSSLRTIDLQIDEGGSKRAF